MKINKMDKELIQLIATSIVNNKKIKQLMTIPKKEDLKKSITKDGVGFISV